MLGAQAPHPVLTDAVAGVLEFVGDEAVAESRVVPMDVDDGVHQVGVVPVPLRDWVPELLVEGLGGEAEHPTGHRHGDALDGQVTDQRELHFGR